MKYQLIDSDDYKAAGIETLFFPGGEPHAKVPEFDKPVLFVAKCRTWNDTGIAACVDNALMAQQGNAPYKLFLQYAPGARQDKHPPYTGFMVAALFGGYYDSINRGCVHFFDMHSDKSAGYYSGYNWMPSDLLNPDLFKDVRAVIAPDEGAAERAEDFRSNLCPNADLIQCSKKRDPHTGALSDYEFPGGKYGKGRYLVVDDICDGGGTFNLLADAFRKQIAYYDGQSLELFVSHGIFSKGLNHLSRMYSKIYTTDSWVTPGQEAMFRLAQDNRLTVFPLRPLYDDIMKEYC